MQEFLKNEEIQLYPLYALNNEYHHQYYIMDT